MQLFLKTVSGLANSADSDQTLAVCTVCICHFVSILIYINGHLPNFILGYSYCRLPEPDSVKGF